MSAWEQEGDTWRLAEEGCEATVTRLDDYDHLYVVTQGALVLCRGYKETLGDAQARVEQYLRGRAWLAAGGKGRRPR